MELYDALIRETLKTLSPVQFRRWAYRPADAWPDAGASELVLQRDAAYELGGSGKQAVQVTCITSDPALVSGDEILLCGPDLPQLRADTPYARIALLLSKDLGDSSDLNQTHLAVRDMDFTKYHVFPKGYMLRMSTENCREQVRVSKAALRKGMNFYRVGCDYLAQYHKNPNVLAVKLLFLTDPAAPYGPLLELARKADGIAQALDKLSDGIPTDCQSCRLKPICDEVEGMRELHFGAKG